MAGNYPDVPSWRMAWDVDGTQFFIQTSRTSDLSNSPTLVAQLNDEDPSTGFRELLQYRAFYWIFPELRDLDGYLLAGHPEDQDYNGGTFYGPLQVSTNTTNGIDGTWTTLKPQSFSGNPGALSVASIDRQTLRTAIEANTVLGIKGIRFFMTGGNRRVSLLSAHFYGEPAPNENPQRLEIWHPTLDQRLGAADLDWGDVPRNTTQNRSFRVKNLHPTLTANSVRTAMSILTDTTPSVVGQAALSKDGGATWAAQQTLTSPLGPGAISPVLQIRRTTPANATLSLWWHRLFADCTSWT